MRIGALTSIEYDRLPLALAFIRHYSQWCAPSDIHIVVQRDHHYLNHDKMVDLIEEMGCNLIDRPQPYETEKHKRDMAELTRVVFPWEGWHFNVDSDEFFDEWIDVNALCENAEADGKCFVRAKMVDRVAADGSFPKLEIGGNPHTIYPYERNLTEKVVLGYAIKDCLLRNPLYGHHNAWGVDLATGRFGGTYKLHHYKWDGGAIKRMRLRCSEENRERFPYWNHFKYFLDFYDANDGKMDMDDPRFIYNQDQFAETP